jgi:succinate dehydrogenase / fumarate reductase flavoprotein subunit
VFLDIASRKPAAVIQRRLPSMYHQFKELADVDITKEPMEVGPTCHYVMGGIRVDADTAAATLPGLFAAGECAAGMHGSNRLGGNSLGDLLVFGRRAGKYAAELALSLERGKRPKAGPDQVEAVLSRALAPFERDPVTNPYTVHAKLQKTMQSLVGIIRTEPDLKQALEELAELREEADRVGVEGHRQFNPGWHLALDLRNMMRVSECIATAALARKESRGGHTRDDYPNADPEFGSVNHVLSLRDGQLTLRTEPLPRMPDELRSLFDPVPAPVPAQPREADDPSGKAGATAVGSGQSRPEVDRQVGNSPGSTEPGPAGLAPSGERNR